MDHQSLEAQLAHLQARLDALEERKRRRGRVLIAAVLLVTGVAVAGPVTMTQFTANTPAVAAQINANFNNLNTRIEEVNTTLQTAIAARTPAGTIAFFATACPTGWSIYTQASGRFVVGTPPSGTVAGQVGSPLSNLENRKHHHMWVEMVNAGSGLWNWNTWNAADVSTTLVQWDNGMDGVGAGIYPLAMDAATPVAAQYFTESVGTNLPYIQLTACIRGT